MFYVLRDKTKLQKVDQFLNGKCSNLNDIDKNALIPISLSMNGRGNVKKFSIICLPKKQDIRKNNDNRKQFIQNPVLMEPGSIDANEKERKRLRLNHLMMLKRLRSRRVRVKRKKQEYSERKVIIAPSQTAHLIKTQYNRMCELWLPTQPKTIRQQCSREVFGYLTQSQFMFHEAKVGGIGYVTVNGIQKLTRINSNQKSNQVLVRDPDSLNYRLAKICVRYK